MKVKVFSSWIMNENCYVLTDEKSGESAVIDPGEYSEKIEKYLTDNNIRVKYILVTHGHFDHIMGIGKIKEKFGGKICIHTLDKDCLCDGEKCLASMFKLRMEINEKADIPLEDNSELFLGENKITVMHTPGHSPGSVCYLTESMIFTGDTIFRLSYGRTDFPGGNETDLYKSALKIFKIDENLTVYPGHGDASTLGYERKNNPLMRG